MMTSDEIAALRELHKPIPPPSCRVCGRALSIASVGGGHRTVWACDGKEIDPSDQTRWRYVEGRPESMAAAEWEHYRKSRWEEPNRTDGTLMRALDAIEASQAQVARLRELIVRHHDTTAMQGLRSGLLCPVCVPCAALDGAQEDAR